MIGILIVTHNNIGQEFINALTPILGKLDALEVVSIDSDDVYAVCERRVFNGFQEVDSEDGVIILTDLFGGTPSNIAVKLVEAGRVELITGANLPMLMRLLRIRETTPLDEAAREAAAAGKRFINLASDILRDGNGKNGLADGLANGSTDSE